MKVHSIVSALAGILALGATASAQTTTTTSGSSGFAPSNFGDTIFTSPPSNATSSTGVSSIYGSNGTSFGFGTGGALVNPASFNYQVTGPNTASITTAANGSSAAMTTNLTFSSDTGGTYVTNSGTTTSTGTFRLAEIPSAPPLANVSVR